MRAGFSPQGIGLSETWFRGTQEAIGQVLDVCRQRLVQSFPEESWAEGLKGLLEAIDQALQSYLS